MEIRGKLQGCREQALPFLPFALPEKLLEPFGEIHHLGLVVFKNLDGLAGFHQLVPGRGVITRFKIPQRVGSHGGGPV